MKKLEIKYININDIKMYEKNPRKNDEAIPYVMNSIKTFGFKNPIILDRNNVIVCGHTRLESAKKLKIEEIPCIYADDLTDEQIKAYRLADNKVSEKASWNYELLEEELENILDIDMSMFDFDINTDDLELDYDSEDNEELTSQFNIPPLSVFNKRCGEWKNRKKAWDAIIPNSIAGRGKSLTGDMHHIQEYYGQMFSKVNSTSEFDPVLCEIMYKWFNIDGGKIYDPFAGGSVRGIVAEKLGYKYTGIDLRQEQIDENNKQVQSLGLNPKWICDDSQNADKYVDNESIDMIFSCPPYFDLEQYSDDERDLSNMDYEQFKIVYKNIIDIACKKLKQDRFAVFVVGDVRDKKGAYRDFIGYTKQCFNDGGLCLYNEIILVEPVGTKILTMKKTFRTRKISKVHQNVLIFYKGNIKKIKENYKEINIDDILNEIDDDK